MKLKFVVGYRTQWGQNVYVTGSAKELGKGDARQAVVESSPPPEICGQQR